MCRTQIVVLSLFLVLALLVQTNAVNNIRGSKRAGSSPRELRGQVDFTNPEASVSDLSKKDSREKKDVIDDDIEVKIADDGDETDMGTEVCPDYEPMDEIMTCMTDMECTYGVKTCCGETIPAMTCTCSPADVYVCEMSDCDYSACPISLDATLINGTLTNTTMMVNTTVMNSTLVNGTLSNTTGTSFYRHLADALAPALSVANTTSLTNITNVTSANVTGSSFYRHLAEALAPVIDTTIEVCPENQPTGDTVCGEKPLSCFYGVETCCGQTVPRAICTCAAGKGLSCFDTSGCRNVDCNHLATK